MAVEYKSVKEALETTPLNKEELAIIADIEAFIDAKILDKFDGGYIIIDTHLVDFTYNPNSKQWGAYNEIKSTRKELMKTELMRRFKVAGWKWDYQEGYDDGPNRPAADYWHLTGNI